MNKIAKFDLAFIFEHGRYTANECTSFPTKEQIEDSCKNLSCFGFGKLKKVVIENIKMA